MSAARSFDVGAHTAELAFALRHAELACCPFCGNTIAINCELGIILHEKPQCERYTVAVAAEKSFDAAVVMLAEKTVQA